MENEAVEVEELEEIWKEIANSLHFEVSFLQLLFRSHCMASELTLDRCGQPLVLLEFLVLNFSVKF